MGPRAPRARPLDPPLLTLYDLDIWKTLTKLAASYDVFVRCLVVSSASLARRFLNLVAVALIWLKEDKSDKNVIKTLLKTTAANHEDQTRTFFTKWIKVVLTSSMLSKPKCVSNHSNEMKDIEHTFISCRLLYRVVLTFNFVDKTQVCNQ